MINKAYLVSIRIITAACILCLSSFFHQMSLSAQSSPLATGDIYQIPIDYPGIYRIDGDWLRANTDWSLSQISGESIQLWTGQDQLQQVPLQVTTDGAFGPDDHILFAGRGEKYQWNSVATESFDPTNYYYLKIGDEPGLRMREISASPAPTMSEGYISTNTVYQEENYNLLAQAASNSGSGQKWVGSEISNTKQVNLADDIDLNGITGGPATVRATLIVRSGSTEQITLSAGGQERSITFARVDLGDVEDTYARIGTAQISLADGTALLSDPVTLFFDKNSSQAKAWIDRVEISYTQNPSCLNCSFSTIGDSTSLTIDLPSQLYQIHNDHEVSQINYTTAFGEYIKLPKDQTYLRLNSEDYLTPPMATRISNQNLRNISDVDLVIIYHEAWQEQAERLAEHRTAHSGLSVATVDIADIYHEFSSGQHSPTGIRYFAKDLWERSPRFKYLLLFGDGSYDYQGRSTQAAFQSFVPTYETEESLDPILSFPSDDYFALLDESSPDNLRGDLDIAVGRLTVRDAAEAEAIVSKIINYDTNPATLGAWRSKIAFLADDEDFNLHLNDAERIAKSTAEKYELFNQEKIYWDAYVQESTPGGNRYPSANEKLNRSIDEGLLVMNYLGHGGPIGWSQERVLNITDIDSWTNYHKLPLIITATCSFTGFDDPTITSAGEAALLNPVGGAIALFTTVRSVYASKNFRLTQSVYDTIFSQVNGRAQTLGEILQHAKNSNPTDNTNARKFLLIGDPSMTLKQPAQRVQTIRFNNLPIEETGIIIDTIGALQQVPVSASITTSTGEIDETFSGEVLVQLYDQPVDITTLENDPFSYRTSFEVQNNVIYSSRVKVTGGIIRDTLIVPVDISYTGGQGRVSYYATSTDGRDAFGSFTDLYIQGTADDGFVDDTPPIIDLSLLDVGFINGDETDDTPVLYATISDDYGINLSSSSIGHEITAILSGPVQQSFILNDAFVIDEDDPLRGELYYQLPHLEPGEYTLTLRAFDIANNMSEAQIAFLVVREQRPRITDLIASPNPSFDLGSQLLIEHSATDGLYDVEISLYDSRGRLIHQHIDEISSQYGRISASLWSGLHSDALNIPNGVYLYGAKIDGPGLEEPISSDLKKIIILK